MLHYVPKYRKSLELESVPLFQDKKMVKLIELFFNWLMNKKYLAHKVKINDSYSFDWLIDLCKLLHDTLFNIKEQL